MECVIHGIKLSVSSFIIATTRSFLFVNGRFVSSCNCFRILSRHAQEQVQLKNEVRCLQSDLDKTCLNRTKLESELKKIENQLLQAEQVNQASSNKTSELNAVLKVRLTANMAACPLKLRLNSSISSLLSLVPAGGRPGQHASVSFPGESKA